MGKPARPELIFHSIDDLLADVSRLQRGGYAKAGKWTLAMILDHLGKAMNAPWDPNTKKVPWPFSVFARLLIHRMVKRKHYPSVRFPAPSDMRPSEAISEEQADRLFREAAEKIKACTGPRVENTPFGSLERDDFVRMHLLHGAHHLGFLNPSN